MSPRALLPAAFVLSLFTAHLLAEDAEGFTPLFNGRDMSGWVRVNGAEDTFTARDGMIIDTGLPIGVIRSVRMYENFILEFDWRHLKSGGNSGCFAWSDGLPHVGGPFPRGIEVQVLDPGYGVQHKGENDWFTCNGDLFPVQGATMTPFGRISKNGARSFPTEDRTKPSPEWNHYHLVADRGELRLSVNGKEVTVGKDCVPRKGYLSLEAEGSEAHFKNLRIKELPSSNTPPEQTANGYEGFKPLFSGKDLSGWKVAGRAGEVWSARGSHFISKAGVKGERLGLWSEKSYRDFVLCVDWRLTKKPEPTATEAGGSAIALRGEWNSQIIIGHPEAGSGGPATPQAAIPPKVKADAPIGKWNRFFIELKGNQVKVTLNDQVVIDAVRLPGMPAEGPIGLQYCGDEVEFANVFIREL